MTTSVAKQDNAEQFKTLSAGGHDRLVLVLRGISMILLPITHIGFSVIKPSGLGIEKVGFGWSWDLLSWTIVWVAAFFATGGALSRHSNKSPIVGWWARRAPRLLLPYYVWVAVVLPIMIVLSVTQPAGLCADFGAKSVAKFIFPPGADCMGLMGMSLWYLMVFIPLSLFSPWLARIFDSRLRVIAPAAGIVVLLGLDLSVATGIASNIPMIGIVHLYLFWAISYYCGFFYADGYLDNLGRKLLWIALALAALTAAMVILGPWPSGVFGAWEKGGNLFPPTLVFMFGGIAGMLLIIWAREPIVALSLRRRVQPAIDWLAGRSLSILIWHLAPATALYWFLRATGLLPSVEAIPDLFERALWLTFVFAAMIPIVNFFYPVETYGDKVGKDLDRRYMDRYGASRGRHDPSAQATS